MPNDAKSIAVPDAPEKSNGGASGKSLIVRAVLGVTLVLVLTMRFAAAQSSAPAWLSALKLSGLSGTPGHPLAVINGRTFGGGEANAVRVPGRSVELKCLAIGEDAVIVQVEGYPGAIELTLSGEVIPLLQPAAQPANPVISPAATTPIPVTSTAPTRSAPRKVEPVQTQQPPKLQSLPQQSFGLLTVPFGVMWTAVGIVLGFGIGIAVKIRWLYRRNLGEAMVIDLIESNFNQPHLLLNNITLSVGAGDTTQIDHVLVTTTGIFVIETKHYQGWIFGHAKDAKWTQQIYRKKSRFQNPLRQNFGHIKALENLLELPKDFFYSVVVFTGDAQFKTDLGPEVLHLAELMPHLCANRPPILDERGIAQVVGRIEMSRKRRSIETDEYHISNIRRRLERQPYRNTTEARGVINPSPHRPDLSVTAAQTQTKNPDEKYMPKE